VMHFYFYLCGMYYHQVQPYASFELLLSDTYGIVFCM
jgi:hypothetical protein